MATVTNEIPVNSAAPAAGRRAVPEEETINVLDLAVALLRRWLILLLCFVVGWVGAGLYTWFFVTPMYESTSMIYIYSKTTSITSLTDLQIGSQLTVDFQIIATTREVIESTIDELGLDTTYAELSDRISITNPDNSRILEITVQDEDPQLAADISNSLSDELRNRIAEVMNTDEPSTVEKAIPATTPVSPSLLKNMVIGGLLLFIIAAAVITVRFITDDTIKNETDVEKYLHLNVLAIVSKNPNMVKKH